MDPIEIGLWVSGGLLLMVVLGMRVAFAAAMAGLVGVLRKVEFVHAAERLKSLTRNPGMGQAIRPQRNVRFLFVYCSSAPRREPGRQACARPNQAARR